MGPLRGVRVVEMAGIGPAPFCGMLLADMGAEVIRIDRLAAADVGIAVDLRLDFLNRGKRAAALDLKNPAATAAVLDLVARADILIEGFRPGVMERLGLGPDVCLAANQRLVFGRMTGWGQTGPLRDQVGHDINYIAMSGALFATGAADGPPVPPLNLVGDFGGGALYLAMGVLAAMVEARASGRGQVIDAAMVDGVGSLMTMTHSFRQAGFWTNKRGVNILDGGAPFYGVYETSDGRHVAVGAIEAKFYAALIKGLGLADVSMPKQHDARRWKETRDRFAAVFRTRTRDEWAAHFAGTDACVSPVLDLEESVSHPLAAERGAYIRRDGVVEPAPAPRFSRTPGEAEAGARDPRADTREALAGWGLSAERLDALSRAGAIA